MIQRTTSAMFLPTNEQRPALTSRPSARARNRSTFTTLTQSHLLPTKQLLVWCGPNLDQTIVGSGDDSTPVPRIHQDEIVAVDLRRLSEQASVRGLPHL